jgi:scyllo-inositol 2-dehydrogenase (NADP+)
VDAVVIATPHNTHHAFAKTALQAGKHVVVDKPFTLTVAEADDLIAEAQRQNRLLTVFHNRRWDWDFLTVHKAIESGLLGEVWLMELNVRSLWSARTMAGRTNEHGFAAPRLGRSPD